MKKKVTFREILLHPDKKKGEADNVLASLFRDMLAAYGVTPSEWELRVERYFRRKHTNEAGVVDKKRVDQDKSNLTRALTKSKLPVKRFEEAMAVLGAESVMWTIQANFPGGHQHTHKALVRNRHTSPVPDDDEDDEDEDDVE